MSKQELQEGDYVLATKYNDGDPRDQWCVGFFKEMLNDRFIVIDSDGKSFRHNGFRRIDKISHRVGAEIVKNISFIENGSFSVWYWRRNIKKLENLKGGRR